MIRERDTFSAPNQIQEHLREASKEAQTPLIDKADLGTGLGQDIEGGKNLPIKACPPSYLTEQRLKEERQKRIGCLFKTNRHP